MFDKYWTGVKYNMEVAFYINGGTTCTRKAGGGNNGVYSWYGEHLDTWRLLTLKYTCFEKYSFFCRCSSPWEFTMMRKWKLWWVVWWEFSTRIYGIRICELRVFIDSVILLWCVIIVRTIGIYLFFSSYFY